MGLTPMRFKLDPEGAFALFAIGLLVLMGWVTVHFVRKFW